MNHRMGDNKILIVEDELIVALDVKRKLTRAGYCVMDVVSTGEDAIEVVKSAPPDLILMDITLAGEMDGVEACTRIRSVYDIPVVYLTAHSDADTLGRARVTGPFGYIIKPYDNRNLQATIEMAIYKNRLQAELREKDESFRNLAENAGDGILIATADGNHVYVNRRCTEITGYDAGRLLDICLDRLLGSRDLGQIREDGAVRDFFPRRCEALIGGDNHVSVELTGTRTVWRGQPALLVLVHDITRLKTAEMERCRLMAQLEAAQRMEALGTLAGGIAHDFNNILAIIHGYTELSIGDLSENTQTRKNLDKVLNACLRAKGVVAQILNFSRRNEPQLKPVSMGMLLQESLKLLRSSIPSTIDIREKIAPGPDVVLADPSQINQVLVHLCTNAAQAMKEKGGVLEVKLDGVRMDESMLLHANQLRPGPFIRITIRDTGSGIEPEVMKWIFDPYFTTRAVGEGSGMGLAVVHGIVKNHGGAVGVRSEQGKGALFRIFLPRLEKNFNAGIKMLKDLPRGSERILFVDDEQFLADLGNQMLEILGYRVVARRNGVEALKLFKVDPSAFDLVVTDMTMPGLTGSKLARELLKVRPDIPIMLCTGFSEQINEQKARAIGIRAVLMKPVSLRDMAVTIREVLDGMKDEKSDEKSDGGGETRQDSKIFKQN